MDIIYNIKAAIMSSILHLLWHFSIGFSQFETPDRQTPRGTGLYPCSIMHPCVRIMHHGNSYLAVELFVALRPWPDTQPECSLWQRDEHCFYLCGYNRSIYHMQDHRALMPDTPLRTNISPEIER